eukprot:6190458-Pleurochrysis_carterae.AAC.1
MVMDRATTPLRPPSPTTGTSRIESHAVEKDDIELAQAHVYIASLVETYLPDGPPTSFHAPHVLAADTLPAPVESALASKVQRSADPDVQRPHMSLAGALLYCSTQVRPGVAYAVGMLCRAVSSPTAELLDAARRVFMHLSRHKHVGLRYVTFDSYSVHGFSDSDHWATRHSTSGYLFMYGRAAILWASKKQATVALSSCEAEIVAASEATEEAIYLRALLSELSLAATEP